MTPDVATEREFWDAAARDPGRWGRASERASESFEACVRPIVDILAPLASSQGAELHVLDLGCGNGRLTLPTAVLLPEATVYGVDVSPAMVDSMFARATAAGIENVRALLCDGRSLPDECATLDAAFSMGVFEHIPWSATWGYMRAVARALVPGGVLRFQFVVGDQAQERAHHYPVALVLTTLRSFGLKIHTVESGLLRPDWAFVTARKPL